MELEGSTPAEQNRLIREAIEDHTEYDQLFKLVQEGEATIEATIAPLIKENLKLRFFAFGEGPCNSKEFRGMSAEAGKAGRLVPLQGGIARPGESSPFKLTDPFDPIIPSTLRVFIGGCVTATGFLVFLSGAVSLLLLLFGGLGDLSWANDVRLWVWLIIAAGGCCFAAKELYDGWQAISWRRRIAHKALEHAEILDGILSLQRMQKGRKERVMPAEA